MVQVRCHNTSDRVSDQEQTCPSWTQPFFTCNPVLNNQLFGSPSYTFPRAIGSISNEENMDPVTQFAYETEFILKTERSRYEIIANDDDNDHEANE
jgi:hypothetical protein